MKKKVNVTEDSWRVFILNQLLPVHRDHPTRSLCCARAIVAEASKFIAEYHGPEIAVGQLDVISNALLGDCQLPTLPEMLAPSHGYKRESELPEKWWHALVSWVFFAGFCIGWAWFGMVQLAGHFAALW